MKRFLIGALLAGAWANTAVAEDYDWSGIYGGVSIGARWSDMDYNAPYRLYEDTWSTSGNGITGGGFVGYNFTYNRIVFGPEVSFMLSDADGVTERRRSGSWGYAENTLRSDATISVNGRIGYQIGNALPYITAGYSRAWYTDEIYVNQYWSEYSNADDFQRNGWNIGVGTDWAFTDHLFARAEYRYFDFGKDDIGNGWYAKYQQHAATLGIGYKF
ncbi:outer membrane immunogenic protein [Ochrobactrum sp. 19YEA23]|uniref:outer membrane protein n=1 Tax=Ochrobactrum sp. 19YEA23 TaxID=3039854 RepID=UPI00247A6712|nr:outer membrane immunogenic protein [Ochrobactrum sp. 19YEA23]